MSPTSAKDSRESDECLVNWAGNHRYATKNLCAPTSISELQSAVKDPHAVKALGARHSFSAIADTSDQLVSIEGLDGPLELDADGRKVSIPAGISYEQLSPWLDERGFALHNLASLPHITVAGCCATATHGSGVRNGNLATAVSAMEIVNSSGEIIRVSREADGDKFSGAVVHLGALGIVCRLTLDVEPTYQMCQFVYEQMSMSDLCENFEEIMSSGYSICLFTCWNGIDQVWIKVRSEDKFEPGSQFFGATRATEDLHPIPGQSAEHCTDQSGAEGKWYDRLPHFKIGFKPGRGEELQSEYFVDRRHAPEAIRAVERLHEQLHPLLFCSELRTVAADELWMSPCYQRPSLAMHFTWKPDWERVRKLLPMLERELSSFEPRPHWGKLFTIAPQTLRSRYERLPDFKELVDTFDSHGKFRNQFLLENLYA